MSMERIVNMHRQLGFSLVELMVGMILGLFLAMGVAQLFVSNNATFRSQEGLAKIQEGGRFAMQRISAAVRMAGFFGCSGVDGNFPSSRFVVSASPNPVGFSSITPSIAVAGGDDVASGTTIGSYTLVDGSDTLTLRGTGLSGISYTGAAITSPTDDIVINDSNHTIVEGDYVVISDCHTITMVRATEDTTSSLVKHALQSDGEDYNTTTSLKWTFGADATVTAPFRNTFFVADSGRDNHEGDDIISLFVQDLNGNIYELVEGVSNFQVLYGVDTDVGDKDSKTERYMTAQEIEDSGAIGWENVISVRVSLLMDSVDAALTKPTSYTFMGASYSPATTDRRLRKEFTGLYSLRNKILGDML